MSAMQLVKTFKKVILISVLVSVVCFMIGMWASYSLSTPTGSTIVLVNLAVFILVRLVRWVQK